MNDIEILKKNLDKEINYLKNRQATYRSPERQIAIQTLESLECVIKNTITEINEINKANN